MKRIAVVGLLVVATAVAAHAADKPTVAGLVKDGYEIKGLTPSNAGPGILLQKGDDVVMCFVAETPDSPDIATQYCKPVH